VWRSSRIRKGVILRTNVHSVWKRSSTHCYSMSTPRIMKLVEAKQRYLLH
jgi:hypothetical protein